jgi:hypothetical protein
VADLDVAIGACRANDQCLCHIDIV